MKNTGFHFDFEPFLLERYFAKYEFSTDHVLCSSDCETVTVKELLKWDSSLEHEILNFSLAYGETLGSPELKKQIASGYQDVDPDDVIVCSGAQEGIFLTMASLLQKSDHVIVQAPCYQSLYQVAESFGVELSFWEMDFNKNWSLDLGKLESLIQPNTKAIICNFPHNPTGFLPTSDEIKKIAEVCDKHGIYLFIDEVYRHLEYNGACTINSAIELSQKGITLSVMSKTFGLPGLRIGWIITKDAELRRRIAFNKDYTTLCNGSLNEHISCSALKNGDKIIIRNKKIIENNLEYLLSFFKKYDHIIDWYQPTAGSICFPAFKNGISSEEICEDLIKEKGVFLLSGKAYGSYNRFFRIGFGKNDMINGLQKFDEYLSSKGY